VRVDLDGAQQVLWRGEWRWERWLKPRSQVVGQGPKRREPVSPAAWPVARSAVTDEASDRWPLRCV